MITLTKVRELDIAGSAQTLRSHLSAASGLVLVGSYLYVVADDELDLGVFRRHDTGPGRLIPIFEGTLPAENPERKRHKPDFEALTLLPPFHNFPHGALLALGSGSKRNRTRSAVLPLDAQGAVQGPAQVVDLGPVFERLDQYFPALNIEGAVVIGPELRLIQRGNGRNSQNAIIRLPLAPFLDALNERIGAAIEPLGITRVDLGRVDGIPFTFTDAAALPDGEMVFTAVAEDTDDTYADGPCDGAAIGILDRDGMLRRLLRLDAPCKIEGVDASLDGGAIRLLLVTDADDPAIPAVLYSATLER